MTHEESEQFRALLQRLRTSAGLSQEELAERAGLSRRGISDLERGRRRVPHPATVRRLAEALGLAAVDRVALQAAGRRTGSHLRAATPSRQRVPLPLTSFIGRKRELAELRRLLETSRLLTLTGTGGVGKTRLALEVLRDVDATFVDLASVSEGRLVSAAVAAALHLSDQPNTPFLALLSADLARRELLLVLDNCEHLATDCAELADHLLRTCPLVRILATSREPLGVAGEQLWPVPPLTVPGPNESERAVQSDAVQLFAERARLARSDFTLDERNLPLAVHVCRTLDGIPLAIELAVARVSMLSLEQIAERLNSALHLLTAGARLAPTRQHTLQSTIDWSFALLTESERVLFERLSVFRGGWDLQAAEVVCAGDGIQQTAVLDLLGRLASKSLVTVHPHATGPVRYRLLEVLRQYAAERLEHRAEAGEVQKKHAEYFLQLRHHMVSDTGETTMASSQVDRDNANIAAALQWSVRNRRARVRRAARVILVDPLQRVLLFRNEDSVPSNPEQPEIRSYWFTPGGGAQPGEPFEVAALREMREETGITNAPLGPCVWIGQYAGFIYGEPILADERYFLVRTPDANVDTSGLLPYERSNWREFRWWTLAELRATAETIRPEGLADLLEPVLKGVLPSSPIRIFGNRELEDAITVASQ